jgi:uncharacterized protein YjiK
MGDLKRGELLLLVAFIVGVVMHLVPVGSVPEDVAAVEVDAAIGAASAEAADPAPDPTLTPPKPRRAVQAWQPPKPDVAINYDLTKDAAIRWKLPGRLKEISGLAMTADDRLLAHNDERGLVFEIDYRQGEIVKGFGLGALESAARDDFEGIAIADDRVFLVTSIGRLYEFEEGGEEAWVPYTTYGTGLGVHCEFEGLAYDSIDRMLLILCKNPRSAEMEDHLAIYRWSVDTKALSDGAETRIPIDALSGPIGTKKFQPSGIEIHPRSGNYFLVAARQAAMAEVTPDGTVLSVTRLPEGSHRQAEGITFTNDGATLIVSDEGAGKRARLTLYPMASGTN